MRPEEEEFYYLIKKFSHSHPEIQKGKMMSSPALVYRDKVFAFLSRKYRMVFKLGKDRDLSAYDFETVPFNPFKKKGPLSGWYEVPYSDFQHWEKLAQEALTLIQSNPK